MVLRKDIFINQRIKFYLNNTINLRPLTPHIMPYYTDKMAIVLWPQILWRHFTLCIGHIKQCCAVRPPVRCPMPLVQKRCISWLWLLENTSKWSTLVRNLVLVVKLAGPSVRMAVRLQEMAKTGGAISFCGHRGDSLLVAHSLSRRVDCMRCQAQYLQVAS